MQIRALMYFDELVRTKSMRQAAENLGVAPTAVSRQIENLEEHFGAALVERSARGVTLTAAGELLAARAGRTLRELEHVQQLIEDLKGIARGRVTIYANGAIVTSLLAPALSEFSRSYPNIRFEVMITSARQAIEAVNAAQADMALTLFAPPMSEAKVVTRFEIAYDVIVSARHAAAGRKEITLRELARDTLALPEKSFGFRQNFDALIERQGLTIDPVFTVSSLEMLKELVLSDSAVTLLPALAVRREIEAGQLAAIPLSSETSIRTHAELSIAPDRQLSFAAGKLIGFIENFMRTKLKSR
ncbi:LysR family transcriptional regulator [Rhizobium mongolense]|uniref:HTH-type transcriptional regulator TtuA n=1 Tax=Rhizobium mongolense TaxID=57676 RepID=A0A7W6WEX3_9HYPH|nr:LysR family transcriptional regulator [Rhizobium mongolense]MBB4275063.1 DNA-binding transcriptional LysR family regulator [Rhizobium mongolense]